MSNFTWHGFFNVLTLIIGGLTAIISGDTKLGALIVAIGLFVKQVVDILYGPVSTKLAKKLMGGF